MGNPKLSNQAFTPLEKATDFNRTPTVKGLDYLTGFTMVEVLVATVVFIIAALGIMSTYAAIRTPSTKTDHKLVAALYGEELLASLRNEVDANTWALTQGAGGRFDCTNGVTYSGTKSVGGITYNYTYTVTCPSGNPANTDDPRSVNLQVTWTEP